MKRYWLINLICNVLSAGFLFGMVWVWRGTDEIDYEAELRIANSKIENVKIKMENNVARVNAALPPQYFISVPFTSQAPEKNWEQPWQDACEEAAVLMLDAYYKNYNLSPPSFDWWNELGKEGEKLGLIWGGSFQDYGHFEWHGRKTLLTCSSLSLACPSPPTRPARSLPRRRTAPARASATSRSSRR